MALEKTEDLMPLAEAARQLSVSNERARGFASTVRLLAIRVPSGRIYVSPRAVAQFRRAHGVEKSKRTFAARRVTPREIVEN